MPTIKGPITIGKSSKKEDIEKLKKAMNFQGGTKK